MESGKKISRNIRRTGTVRITEPVAALSWVSGNRNRNRNRKQTDPK